PSNAFQQIILPPGDRCSVRRAGRWGCRLGGCAQNVWYRAYGTGAEATGVLGGIAFARQPDAHDSWDAVADFSTTTNPNGAWSYGITQTRGSEPFEIMDVPTNYGPALVGWTCNNASSWVIKNLTNSIVNERTITHEPDR